MIFRLFHNCIPVKGSQRSLICDLQQCKYYYIPNDLFNILSSRINLNIENLREEFGEVNNETLNDYFHFLVDKDLVFNIHESNQKESNFTSLSLDFDIPSIISNCIVDIDTLKFDLNIVSYLEVIKEISLLNCKNLTFRFFSFSTEHIKYLNSLLNMTRDSRINDIKLIVPDNVNVNYIHLLKENIRISLIIVYNSPENTFIEKYGAVISRTTQNLNSSKCCGIVNFNLFVVNIQHFSESLHHNSCLNRKISIDTEGNIKNCPSMKESFGNIKDTTLAEAIEKPGFKKYWDINKDKIHVCKDCEFRYVCTDCRAYVEDPEDIHSKPLKCGYNPYTGEWSEWSKNPLKQKAIDFYGMGEMVDDINSVKE